MKRPIKFRGRDPITGKFVYYDLKVIDGYLGTVTTDDYNYVQNSSIAQLVGYDKDGKEIYEGDIVVSEYGDEIVARLMDNLPPKAKLQEASNETFNQRTHCRPDTRQSRQSFDNQRRTRLRS